MLKEDPHKVLVVCMLLAVSILVWMIYYEPSPADYHFSVTSNILATTTLSSTHQLHKPSLCDNSTVCDSNQNSSQHVETGNVGKNLDVPVPRPSKPIKEILEGAWTSQLQDILTFVNTSNGPVSIVAANYAYTDVLINWLITAKLKLDNPLQDVIVLSLDLDIHNLLNNKKIVNIHVPIKSVVNITRVTRTYHAMLIVRLTVLRMINYWGYDVAHYDADAMVLKNPQRLYEQHADSDVVGSSGGHPKELSNEWGFTLCMGVIMLRSTQQTELFWEAMSKVTLPPKGASDDQRRLNYALKAMNVTWDETSVVEHASHGLGQQGFKVTALPQIQVCRSSLCNPRKRRDYYIWHKGGEKTRESKVHYASQVHSWFLRPGWENITRSTQATGEEWLQILAIMPG